MTTKRTAETTEAVNEPQATAEEVVYTVKEFAAAAGAVFGKGTSPDIVVAAFRVNGLKEATVAEAKKLVKAFAEKEVK